MVITVLVMILEFDDVGVGGFGVVVVVGGLVGDGGSGKRRKTNCYCM